VNPSFPKKLLATQTLKAISMEVKVGRRLKDKAVKCPKNLDLGRFVLESSSYTDFR